jgi:hypothetical protein
MVGGGLFLAAAMAYLVWLLWPWGTGGRHRRPRASAALQLLTGPDPAEADPDTMALLLDADTAGFAHCPAEGRTTPHHLHGDGSRTCCRCETTTAGDQT